MAFEIMDYNFEEHKKGGPKMLYQASDIDEGTTSYYGLVSDDGHWLIIKKTATQVRYAEGKTSTTYLAAWIQRAGTTTYDYYYTLSGTL